MAVDRLTDTGGPDCPPHGGNLTWAAQRYGIPPGRFIDFSANVNPLGPPGGAMAAARRALEGISRYPDPQGEPVREALAGFLGIAATNLMVGNGSTELIHQLCGWRRPRKATIVAPTFGEYERAARAAGAQVSYELLDEDGLFALDPARLARAASSSDITFFCNPASPHGRVYPREKLLPAIEECRSKGRLLVADESFIGFCEPEESAEASVIGEAVKGGVAVISTTTKIFALAGLRGPGWLASDASTIDGLQSRAMPWRVNSIASAASCAALKDGVFLEETRSRIREWRQEMSLRLEASGRLRAYPSSTNFLLLKILDEGYDSGRLCDELGMREILIRNCANFAGLDARFVRVSVQKPELNARLIEAMGEVWK